jgi:general secretion pathway protein I
MFRSRPDRKAARYDDRGFALVEVLVAFTLAAAMLAVLFQLFSTDLQSVARADAYTRAVLLAESRLDGIGVLERLVPGVLAGRIDERFSWKVAIERYPSDNTGDVASPALLYRVQVTVQWREGGTDSAVSLETLRMALAEPGST